MGARVSNGQARLGLRYFEDVLAVEFATIAERRALRFAPLDAKPVQPNLPFNEKDESRESRATARAPAGQSRKQSPDPTLLFERVSSLRIPLKNKTIAGRRSSAGTAAAAETRRSDFGASNRPDKADAEGAAIAAALPRVDLNKIEADKQRPMPVPCDAAGLAFSGGGIRSATVCLGALQALHATGRLDSFDYLSTVSGGGYIGATLSAAAAKMGAQSFPFGGGKADDPAVSHLRDYSNYLLPRGRSSVTNFGEAASILLRGLLSNCILVAAALFLLAVLTRLAYPTFDSRQRKPPPATTSTQTVSHRSID